MLQNLQNDAKFQKFQLDNLVDFEKCCKTRIYLQKSVPIQPKTSNILPKICQKLATTLRVRGPTAAESPRSSGPSAAAGSAAGSPGRGPRARVLSVEEIIYGRRAERRPR